MNGQPVAVKPDRRRRVKLGLAQSMMLLLALLLLLLLAHLGPALARRQAKVDDEWMDDQEEGASRIGGGIWMSKKPLYMGTVWSNNVLSSPAATGRLVGNVIRLNMTHVIMHSGSAADMFHNDTSGFFKSTLGTLDLGFGGTKDAQEPSSQSEQISFAPSSVIELLGVGESRVFDVEKAQDELIGRTPFHLYTLKWFQPISSLRQLHVGKLTDFMESNRSELGVECSIYGWSSTPEGNLPADPKIVRVVRVAVDHISCDPDGECKLRTSSGGVCRNNADRGSPVLCGKGVAKKITYLVDTVIDVKPGECSKGHDIYAFHTAEMFPSLNKYSSWY